MFLDCLSQNSLNSGYFVRSSAEIDTFRAIISRNRHFLKIWPISFALLVAVVVIHLATFCRIAEFAQPPVPKEPFEI